MLRHVNLFGGRRANIHKTARTTAQGRAEIARRVILEAQAPGPVAAAFGVCLKTVGKWVSRFKAGGLEALADRSSRPLRLHMPTPQAVRDMIHLDIKKHGRFERIGHRITGDRTGQFNQRSKGKGEGWEYVQGCIDDASRLSFTQIHQDEKAPGAVTRLRASVAYYQGLGVIVRRVLTDNGACYKPHAFRDACREIGLKHIRTRPYTPRTNGKAEGFIQTALREWAYARPYETSDQRAGELPAWTYRYNWHRPHGGIKSQTLISRLGLSEDNLLRGHI